MVVHQFEACYEDVQELLRARSVETGMAEGLNALQLLGDTAFPCFRVLYGDCKVALYHLVGHHAVYVRNGVAGSNSPGRMRLPLCARPLRPVFGLQEIASEPVAEFLGVVALGKAEDSHVNV